MASIIFLNISGNTLNTHLELEALKTVERVTLIPKVVEGYFTRPPSLFPVASVQRMSDELTKGTKEPDPTRDMGEADE